MVTAEQLLGKSDSWKRGFRRPFFPPPSSGQDGEITSCHLISWAASTILSHGALLLPHCHPSTSPSAVTSLIYRPETRHVLPAQLLCPWTGPGTPASCSTSHLTINSHGHKGGVSKPPFIAPRPAGSPGTTTPRFFRSNLSSGRFAQVSRSPSAQVTDGSIHGEASEFRFPS